MQGTVLGPVLFLFFKNDLPDSIYDRCTCTLFTDDTTLQLHWLASSSGTLSVVDLDTAANWDPPEHAFQRQKRKHLSMGMKAKGESVCLNVSMKGISFHRSGLWYSHPDYERTNAQHVLFTVLLSVDL